MQCESYQAFIRGSTFVIYGKSVLGLMCVIFFCNTYEERSRSYNAIIFGLVAVHLGCMLTVWSSVLGMILVNCKVI